jgi:hypothetical protein
VELCQVQRLGDCLAQMPVALRRGQVFCEKGDVSQPPDGIARVVQDRRGEKPVVQVEAEHPQIWVAKQGIP